jgi:hypothetical protein
MVQWRTRPARSRRKRPGFIAPYLPADEMCNLYSAITKSQDAIRNSLQLPYEWLRVVATGERKDEVA